MAQLQTLKRIVWHMPGWQSFLSQLHDELGLEWWDEAVIDTALGEIEAQLRVLVGDLPQDELTKRMVIENYQGAVRVNEKALATAGIDTRASMAEAAR